VLDFQAKQHHVTRRLLPQQFPTEAQLKHLIDHCPRILSSCPTVPTSEHVVFGSLLPQSWIPARAELGIPVSPLFGSTAKRTHRVVAGLLAPSPLVQKSRPCETTGLLHSSLAS